MENVKVPKIDEQACLAKWQELIAKFKMIIDGSPKPSSVMGELIALKEEAKNTVVLYSRQIEGIIARCDNYLSGTYGNTKTDENMAQQPQTKK